MKFFFAYKHTLVRIRDPFLQFLFKYWRTYVLCQGKYNGSLQFFLSILRFINLLFIVLPMQGRRFIEEKWITLFCNNSSCFYKYFNFPKLDFTTTSKKILYYFLYFIVQTSFSILLHLEKVNIIT